MIQNIFRQHEKNDYVLPIKCYIGKYNEEAFETSIWLQ